MPRPGRYSPGGMVFHVLNRSVGRRMLFAGYQVVRYIERNALRANLVKRAELWPWSSPRRAERDQPASQILLAFMKSNDSHKYRAEAPSAYVLGRQEWILNQIRQRGGEGTMKELGRWPDART
jgi:hypothetical protein